MLAKLLLKNIAKQAEPSASPSPQQSLCKSKSEIVKPPNRTAMGEFIVQPGEKPLTSLGDPLPGPADYNPSLNLTKYSAAQHSIVGRQKTKEHGIGLPGPSDYHTSGDLIWKKQFAIKGRGNCYFDEEASKYCTVIGPAKYNVEYKHFGLEGPKYSMAHKQPGDIITGPPNSIVQPVDTHGYNSPGPNYRPNSHYWTRGPKKSMGAARKLNPSDGPGPADYNIPSPTGGPAHSFGAKLPPPPNIQRTINKISPAPNNYDIGTTVGTATAKSISGRHVESKYAAAAKATPSPAVYYPQQFAKCKNCPTLAYRWFDVEEPVRPGPGDYSTTTSNMKKDPAYTVRQRTKPSYPESLHYVSKGVADIPGPGSYQVSRDISENDSPAYSMKRQLKTTEKDTPAPNKYPYEKKSGDTGSKFSMGKRFDLPDSRRNNPGPGAYSPKLLKSAPKFTMKGRTDFVGKNEKTPAPNAYVIPPAIKMNQYKSGVAFKSRPSPYVYSGFRTSKLLDNNSQVAVNA